MPYFIKILVAPKTEMVGKKIPLVEGQTIVGRVTPPCTLQLEGAKVSKRHCTFHLNGTVLMVQDHGSSNGLFVNGKKVTTQELKAKDRLVIGEYTVEIVGK